MKIVNFTNVKRLIALVVIALLSSLLILHIPAFAVDDGLIELTLTESDVVYGGWANRSLSRVPPEEVEDAVSRIQYVPDEEELPYEALEMEPHPKMPPFISAGKAEEDVERARSSSRIEEA